MYELTHEKKSKETHYLLLKANFVKFNRVKAQYLRTFAEF